MLEENEEGSVVGLNDANSNLLPKESFYQIIQIQNLSHI